MHAMVNACMGKISGIMQQHKSNQLVTEFIDSFISTKDAGLIYSAAE